MVFCFRLITQVTIGLCFLAVANSAYAVDSLRLLVPPFIGEKPLSQHVRTTIYVELIKAFRQVGPGAMGGWIIYGLDELPEPSHDAAIYAGSFPSVSANLAIWGQAHRYGDGVIVQLFLTILPPIKKEQKRPEVWRIKSLSNDGQSNQIDLDLPSRFYEFEPMILKEDVVINFETPEGIPLYSERKSGEIIGFLGKLMYFSAIYDDAIKVRSDNGDGWVRTKDLSGGSSEAIPFAKGLVRLLRGDWKGSEIGFSEVLGKKNVPQNLRIYALLYSGLTKEQQGESGLQEFKKAYHLNRLDKASASYLLMSRLANIVRARRQNEGNLEGSIYEFKRDLKLVRVLFPKNDKWLQQLESVAK